MQTPVEWLLTREMNTAQGLPQISFCIAVLDPIKSLFRIKKKKIPEQKCICMSVLFSATLALISKKAYRPGKRSVKRGGGGGVGVENPHLEG